MRLAPGARLSIRAGPSGAWCYVAIFGRVDLVPALGSLATHVRSGLGGLQGRSLRAGDVLPIADLREPPAAPMALIAPWLAREGAAARAAGAAGRLFRSPRHRRPAVRELAAVARSDRMAYRLDGPRLDHAKGHDIVSDGVAFGAIQVPGDGAPLALMADRQPTGGYPEIAHVIGADLGALAQTRPGESLRFRQVSWEEAVVARRAWREAIAAGPRLARGELSSEALLSANLIGGAVSATDEPETN